MRSPPGSGSCRWSNIDAITNVIVPTQMPNAIASPPMIVIPDIHQHAEAELEVERQAGDPGEAAAVAQPSLCCVTPPNVASARRRASSGDKPFFPHEPMGLHVDVETHLFVRPRLGGTRCEQETQARARSS